MNQLQEEKDKMLVELKKLEAMDQILPLNNQQLRLEKQNQVRLASLKFRQLLERGNLADLNLEAISEEQAEQNKNRKEQFHRYSRPFLSDNVLEFNREDLERLREIQAEQEMIAVQDLNEARQREMSNSIFGNSLMKKWDRVRKKLRMIGRIKRLYDEVKLYGTSCRVETSIKRHEVIQELEQMLNKQNEQINKAPPKQNSIINITILAYILTPDSPIKLYWSYILMLLLIYTAFVTPVRIAFIDTTDTTWLVWEILIDTLFLIDLIITFRSAYYNEEGILIVDGKQIAMNYIKGWFIIDTMAIFPSDLIFDNGYDQVSAYFKLTRLPRLYKIVSISQVMSVVQKAHKTDFIETMQDLLNLNSTTVRVLKFFFTVIICVHIMGCFWYFVAKIYKFGPGTWVYELELTDLSEYELYLTSIYWAVATICTVGFGDIHAYNDTERIVCIFWMFFGVGFYSFTVGSLSSLLGALDTRESHLQAKITFMDEFCEDAKLTMQMKHRIRKALEYNSMINIFSQAEIDDFLSEIPTNLKFQIAQAMYSGLRNRLSFFRNKDSVFISTLVPKLQPMKIQSGEFIYNKGEYPNQVYFIVNGRVNMVLGVYSITFKTYVTGSYFGEIEIFDNSARFHSCRSEVECELLSIEQSIFKKILQAFPDYLEEIKATSLEKLIRERQAIEKLQNLTGLSQTSDFFRKKRTQSMYKSVKLRTDIQFVNVEEEFESDMKSSNRSRSSIRKPQNQLDIRRAISSDEINQPFYADENSCKRLLPEIDNEPLQTISLQVPQRKETVKKDDSPKHDNQIQLFKKNSIDKDILKLKDIGRRTTFRRSFRAMVAMDQEQSESAELAQLKEQLEKLLTQMKEKQNAESTKKNFKIQFEIVNPKPNQFRVEECNSELEQSMSSDSNDVDSLF